MTGDLGSEGGRERSRPSFLPPVDGYPPPREDAWEPATGPAGERPRGAAWTLATIAAAGVLLVSAFLPWAHAQMIVELFGRPIGRDLGSLAGIDAHTVVLAVPVLAVVAIALAAWDLIGRDARVGSLAVIPGMLALLVCGIFVVRLGDVRDNLPMTGLDFGYQISIRYGWYLAVVTSLLVAGFSLARTIADRMSRPHQERPDGPQESPTEEYADQQYYQAEPFAAWPEEDPARGRRRDDGPQRDTDEPGKG